VPRYAHTLASRMGVKGTRQQHRERCKIEFTCDRFTVGIAVIVVPISGSPRSGHKQFRSEGGLNISFRLLSLIELHQS
jgi:hypothetical protein